MCTETNDSNAKVTNKKYNYEKNDDEKKNATEFGEKIDKTKMKSLKNERFATINRKPIEEQKNSYCASIDAKTQPWEQLLASFFYLESVINAKRNY